VPQDVVATSYRLLFFSTKSRRAARVGLRLCLVRKEDMLYDHVCGAHGCIDPNCRVEYGYCHCGCGGETNFVTSGSKRRGTYQETPRRFLLKHNLRGKTPVEESKRERGAGLCKGRWLSRDSD
jgi:hypothetical protein